MKQFKLKDKGQILLLALVMFSISSILSAVMASMWNAEIEVRNQEKRSLTAFYLAQAAAEEAKAYARAYSTTTTSADVYLGGGRYRYTIASGTGERIINATGEVLDGAGAVIATRRIQVRVAGTPPPSSAVTVISGTWDEQ